MLGRVLGFCGFARGEPGANLGGDSPDIAVRVGDARTQPLLRRLAEEIEIFEFSMHRVSHDTPPFQMSCRKITRTSEITTSAPSSATSRPHRLIAFSGVASKIRNVTPARVAPSIPATLLIMTRPGIRRSESRLTVNPTRRPKNNQAKTLIIGRVPFTVMMAVEPLI